LAGSPFNLVHLTTPIRLAVVRDVIFSYVIILFKIRLLYHIHSGSIPEIVKTNKFTLKLLLIVMRRASIVVVMDQRSLDCIIHLAPDIHVVLIPNCVNIEQIRIPMRVEKKVKTVLFIGWVIPTKGIAELVEAWSILNKEGWRLVIVGPGDLDYQDGLLRKFKPKNIDFLGELIHVRAMEHMSNCDLFVLPSYTEGFPFVVLEAMALGHPIVATDVGAIPEMFDGDAGFLVKSRDVQALAESLGRVIDDSKFRDRIAKNGFEKVRSLYTTDIVFSAFMQIWKYGSHF
jgi:glycosyltransferase involved in cell wall biosynthesis